MRFRNVGGLLPFLTTPVLTLLGPFGVDLEMELLGLGDALVHLGVGSMALGMDYAWRI